MYKPTYYELLGVDESESIDEAKVKAAYIKKVTYWHADQAHKWIDDDEFAGQVTAKLVQAKETL